MPHSYTRGYSDKRIKTDLSCAAGQVKLYSVWIRFPQVTGLDRLGLLRRQSCLPWRGHRHGVPKRLIRSQGGCGLMMTEFTSSHGVVKMLKARNPEKTRNFRYLVFEAEEHPISAQLFGSDPEVMADAAKVCEQLGFDAVDITLDVPEQGREM